MRFIKIIAAEPGCTILSDNGGDDWPLIPSGAVVAWRLAYEQTDEGEERVSLAPIGDGDVWPEWVAVLRPNGRVDFRDDESCDDLGSAQHEYVRRRNASMVLVDAAKVL